MRFRPAIDIHHGSVKQLIGATLSDDASDTGFQENYVGDQDAVFYADIFHAASLTGGHVILLQPEGSKGYTATLSAALNVLRAHPGVWQAGGGITPENAGVFLDAGASHVIVTSYVFRDGIIDTDRLRTMEQAVGKDHLVLDLSCKQSGTDETKFLIVTNRWQRMTDTELNSETLHSLAAHCDEFLVHAADVEGKMQGISEPVLSILASIEGHPVTYAGGIRSMEDIRRISKLGKGKIDYTVGSALDVYGGKLRLADILEYT